MVQIYWHSTRLEKNIVAILHIYGASAILLLFCDNIDAKSESQRIKIGVAETIFTQKTSKWFVGQKYPYSTRWEQDIIGSLHIYGSCAIILLFCDNQDTEFK